MPAIMVDAIEFDETKRNFRISLRTLAELFPHIKTDSELQVYLVEIRDQSDRLIRRFKPFMKLWLKVGEYWDSSKWNAAAYFSEDDAFELNLIKNYRIAVIITKINGRIVFPFELKTVGYYQPEKILEHLSSIESSLLLLSVEQPILDNAVSHLYDSQARLGENDIEGARTSLRKSLEVLVKFVSGVVSLNEAENFKDNLKKLTKDLAAFLHYGGPHLGPTPRTTTEMIMEFTAILISYLARAIQDKTIELKDSLD